MITDWAEAQMWNVLAAVLVVGGLVLALAGHFEGRNRLPIGVGVGLVMIGVMVRLGVWT
ncbi:hypothetical protein [Streptomyces prunicolor]|uniref:hypothetical protein n=1 Tax=Streptomyces prunicolor TaxID=67348 RepID=UPI00131A4069|nr:hypothetical protein [Streptomyces prunicolor]